jgi:hypothetical protein
MKYNKGFAPLVVLLIVLGVLAVGGVAYFAGKSPAPKSEVSDNSTIITTQNQQEQNNTTKTEHPELPAPIFTTNAATNITSSSATLNASIFGLMDTIHGTGQQSYFEYGTSPTNLSLTSSVSGPTQGSLSKVISGLQPNTTYYFRVAINYGPNSIPANSHQYGNILSFKTISQISSACGPNSPASIKVLSPNGGQLWKIGQTYPISWSTCNPPANSWVKLTYFVPSPSAGQYATNGTIECINYQTPASQGTYSWKISESLWGCLDAGWDFQSSTSFQTKVKIELYTGTPACQGLPPPNAPCLTGTRTLHAQDESDNNFTVTNLP